RLVLTAQRAGSVEAVWETTKPRDLPGGRAIRLARRPAAGRVPGAQNVLPAAQRGQGGASVAWPATRPACQLPRGQQLRQVLLAIRVDAVDRQADHDGGGDEDQRGAAGDGVPAAVPRGGGGVGRAGRAGGRPAGAADV